MATDAELDALVKEKVSELREKKKEVSPDIVAKAIRHRREEVLLAFTRFCDAERAAQEEMIKSAISQKIGAAIITDRDTVVVGVTKIRDEHIAHLQCNEILLIEEIGSLRTELAAMHEQALNDVEAINTLHHRITGYEVQIHELRGQIEAKAVELSVERSNSAEIFTTVAALNQSLGEKKYEAYAEQKRASDLQAQREEMAKLLKEMEKSRDEAKSKVGQLQEKYTDLASRSQKTEKQLEDERKARLDAVAKHAEAKAKAEVFEGQLAAMKKERADQPIFLAPAGREPEAAK